MKRLPKTGAVELAPSILSADFSRLADHVREISDLVRILHIDIMDGHFVPNMTFGPIVVKWLRGHFDLFFDTHLMIADAVQYAPQFVKAGSDGITFHAEAVDDAPGLIRQLRELDVSVGVSVKPKTSLKVLEPYIEDVDLVLLMSVEPGFGGQGFIPESVGKCRELRKMLRDDQRLEVDGGINLETVKI
ncbi:MAG: ribulose-phosphate 3-epimerase, partial [Planctomycetes bacterium]|nr:ribulose-phosphate 3-epimerase [Planctomycetota bacterium]